MTSEQTERMNTMDVDELRTYLNEEECWCEDTKGECMPCQTKTYVEQLTTDLTEARSQLAEAVEALEFYVHQGDMGERARTTLSRVSKANEQRSRLTASPETAEGGEG
jgi:hypothetical protein